MNHTFKLAPKLEGKEEFIITFIDEFEDNYEEYNKRDRSKGKLHGLTAVVNNLKHEE